MIFLKDVQCDNPGTNSALKSQADMLLESEFESYKPNSIKFSRPYIGTRSSWTEGANYNLHSMPKGFSRDLR
jgi:hypothetical protein